MSIYTTLVIQTQYKENYGSIEAPHWKFKGGSTYFVTDLTATQVAKIEANGIPTLTDLIEYNSGGSEEYVLDYEVRELGKNGDGKTTIANAIIYALYGRVEGVKLSDLPNRINKELHVIYYER